MRVTLVSFLSLASLPLLAIAVPSNYTIHHRFLPHPRQSAIDPPWSELGTIQVDFGGAGLEAALKRSSSGRSAEVDDGRGWYQVGVAGEAGEVSHISSVRSCHTAAPQIYRFILSLSTKDPDATLTGLQLDLSNVGRDGKCPASWFASGDKLFLPNVINSEVVLKTPNRAKQINLAPPPTVDPTTGKAAEPVPEKSFLQKYWLPLLGVGFFVVSQMAPEPPRQGGEGGAAS